MNVAFNKLDNVNATVTITLEEKDYQDQVKKTLKEINQNRPEPGFRAGHVPAGLIQKKYGKAVKYDTINKVVSDALYDYIKENELQVLGNPVPVKDEEFNLEGSEFTFTFNLGVAPAIDTHVNKDLTIPYYKIEVSDDMIDRQSEMFRNRFGAQVQGETIDEKALVKGQIFELNEDGSVKENGIVVEDGIVSPQHFKNEEQKNIFVGKKLNDTFAFNPAATCDSNMTELSSMLHITKEEAENAKGNFNFTVKEIIVLQQAELNQEFFDNVLGKDKAHNEEEYRKALSEMIAQQLTSDSNYRFSIDAHDIIAKAVGDIELPDKVLKDYLKTQDEKFTDDNIEEEYAKTRPGLVWQLIREEILKQLSVKLEQDDLLNVAKMIAQSQFAQYGMTNLPEEALEKYANNLLKEKESREHIVNQTIEMRLYAAIKEAVTVEEKTVNVEQFNELFKAEA